MADDNDAAVQSCQQTPDGTGYTVSVRSKGTVGRSAIKGTENKHAEAVATAVVEPICSLGDNDVEDGGSSASGSTDAGTAAGTSTSGGGEGDGGDGDGKAAPVEFICRGSDLTIDPTVPLFELDLADFYSIHLSK